MKTETDYSINNTSISVSRHYCSRKNRYYIIGSLSNKIECGGSSFAKEIKTCIKKFVKDNNFKIETISHSIYGIYTANIIT